MNQKQEYQEWLDEFKRLWREAGKGEDTLQKILEDESHMQHLYKNSAPKPVKT